MAPELTFFVFLFVTGVNFVCFCRSLSLCPNLRCSSSSVTALSQSYKFLVEEATVELNSLVNLPSFSALYFSKAGLLSQRALKKAGSLEESLCNTHQTTHISTTRQPTKTTQTAHCSAHSMTAFVAMAAVVSATSTASASTTFTLQK